MEATDTIADMGYLFLGSRLKRLSERMMAGAGQVLRDAGLPIAPAHFPLLAALDRAGPQPVGDLGARLGISQPAVTRLAGQLETLGLVTATRGRDQRQRHLALSAAGKALIDDAKARLWPDIEMAVAEMCRPLQGDLLAQIAGVERALAGQPLPARVAEVASRGLTLRPYSDELAADFYRINAEWISAMFTMEENDRKILSQPREMIVEKGGVILFVEAAGLGIVGTCALMRIGYGVYELTKMGVLAHARGRKAGEFLLSHVQKRAVGMKIETLYLLTNRRCEAAIHLYEKFGFAHDARIMADYGSRYERCDVAMRWSGAA